MKKLGILLLTAIAAAAVTNGCSDPDPTPSTTSSSSTSTGSSSSSSSGGSFGDMPTYGTQLDRFGRPAINTALTATFSADDAMKGMAKDAYNANGDETMWSKDHAAEIAKNLAIIDSLDANCGNQIAADMTKMDLTRYGTLTGVLADDRQWLNTDNATCDTYLAVEVAALGTANTDCGGRALHYDVIDVSYSALAAGSIAKPPPVGDGIDVPPHANGKTFPYLATPLP